MSSLSPIPSAASTNSDDYEGISSPWIKTESLTVGAYLSVRSLLWRNDVEYLGWRILKVEWSPRGCLIDAHRGVFWRRLLCSVSSSLHALSEASCKIRRTSTSSTPDRTELIGSIRSLLPLCSWRITSGSSRTRSAIQFRASTEQRLIHQTFTQ